jgi:hypothetical protein
MARFYIETLHRPEDCLASLDEIIKDDANAIARYDFGCAVGSHDNHVCYTTVEADNESAARALLPRSTAAQSKITEVGKFTAEQIRSFHGS